MSTQGVGGQKSQNLVNIIYERPLGRNSYLSTQCAAVITQFLFNKVPPHMCVKLSTQLFSVLLSNSIPLSSDLSTQSLTSSLTSLFLTQVPSQILLLGYLQPADLQSNCSETIKHETRCSKGRKLKKFQINRFSLKAAFMNALTLFRKD